MPAEEKSPRRKQKKKEGDRFSYQHSIPSSHQASYCRTPTPIKNNVRQSPTPQRHSSPLAPPSLQQRPRSPNLGRPKSSQFKPVPFEPDMPSTGSKTNIEFQEEQAAAPFPNRPVQQRRHSVSAQSRNSAGLEKSAASTPYEKKYDKERRQEYSIKHHRPQSKTRNQVGRQRATPPLPRRHSNQFMSSQPSRVVGVEYESSSSSFVSSSSSSLSPPPRRKGKRAFSLSPSSSQPPQPPPKHLQQRSSSTPRRRERFNHRLARPEPILSPATPATPLHSKSTLKSKPRPKSHSSSPPPRLPSPPPPPPPPMLEQNDNGMNKKCSQFKTNDLLNKQWLLLENLGRGSFGETFKAFDRDSGELVAIKFEFQGHRTMSIESKTLQNLQPPKKHECLKDDNIDYNPPSTCHVPLLYAYGIEDLHGNQKPCRYMVMELLGPNLAKLREQLPKQRFSLSTSVRLGLRMLNNIQYLHDRGYVHRDIKPSNFVMGRVGLDAKNCYLIDFGEARRYCTTDGANYRFRETTRFRGTIRYASVNSHWKRDLCRYDDLWSWLFVLVEFMTGTLPWRNQGGREHMNRICNIKLHHILDGSLVDGLPEEFRQLLEHLKKSLMAYETFFSIRPNYTYLRDVLQNLCTRYHIQTEDLYDWEVGGYPQPAPESHSFPAQPSLPPATPRHASPQKERYDTPRKHRHYEQHVQAPIPAQHNEHVSSEINATTFYTYATSPTRPPPESNPPSVWKRLFPCPSCRQGGEDDNSDENKDEDEDEDEEEEGRTRAQQQKKEAERGTAMTIPNTIVTDAKPETHTKKSPSCFSMLCSPLCSFFSSICCCGSDGDDYDDYDDYDGQNTRNGNNFPLPPPPPPPPPFSGKRHQDWE